MMLDQKIIPRHRYHYVLLTTVLLVVFTFYSFGSYNQSTKNPDVITISLADTVPVLMDTIITLDPESYMETIQVIKKKKEHKPLEEMKIIRMHPEILTFSDTLVILDPNTYEEKVQIVNIKMVKGYKMLIDHEYSKPNPDFKLIDKWTKEGVRQ